MSDINIETFASLSTFSAAFALSLFLTGFWILIARRAGLVARDMNKYRQEKPVAESGGIAVIISFTFSILLYIFFRTFVMPAENHLIVIFSMLISILLAGMIGFVDDILGWKIGLRQWQKPLLTIPIAIPLIVVNAGESSVSLPIIGHTDLGILYPLLVIPAGIVGAANGFNMLAGYNMLEGGLGAIILSTMGIVALRDSSLWVAVLAFSGVAALLGFLFYNRYPAKVFPGDSLTYFCGALIAIIAILGNMEKTAIILFAPFFIEFVLKARSRFRAETFGRPDENNRLSAPSKKVYSLAHAVLRYFPSVFGRKAREMDVVASIFLFQLLFSAIALIAAG